jgi:cell division protein FtsI/penicillin-binding protein 2
MTRTLQEKHRLGILFFFVVTFFVVAIARLVHLQVILGDKYQEIVRKQSSGTVTIPPQRGEIYDRHGRIVASTVRSYSLYAYPQNTAQLNQIGAYLDRVFGLQAGTAIKRYKLAINRFRWIHRMLDDELAARISTDAPEGLYLRHEPQREYPFGLVGRQILGFTDIDHVGQAGIELTYDSLLGGVPGVADIRRDGLRNTYRVNETAMVKPKQGKSIVLTIDWRLQEVVEEELKKAVEEYHAQSGQACFMDCRTGEILAMAHYDPSEKYPDKPYKARVVTDLWEPGSVFKPVAATALLDANLINFNDTTYCENGRWKVDRRILRDDKKHEWLTFRQILEQSSNIGIAKHALDIGGETILRYARRFGFGQRTDIGLPGESAGTLPADVRWSDYNTSAFAIGQSVGVTTLQMTRAIAAIANDGVLLQPRLVYGFVDNDGRVRPDENTSAPQRVMKETSADTLKALLRGVVERGTAEVVNSPVVAIAGKTGTAQIFNTESGHYFIGRFMASFGGFFPYEDPMVAGVVVLRAPQPVHYGGLTSGPAFRKIAERYVLMHPDRFSPEAQFARAQDSSRLMTIEVPDLLGRDLSIAQQIASDKGLTLRGNRNQGTVIWQFPPPDRLAVAGEPILVAVEASDDTTVVMADLKGLSLRKVSAFLDFAGVKTVVDGCGQVRRQSIRPGQPLSSETTCRIACQPG